MTKVYLGDAVYAEIDEFGTVKLTTENGYGRSNIIYLERETIQELNDLLRSWADKLRQNK